jgi:hypothetical protein
MSLQSTFSNWWVRRGGNTLPAPFESIAVQLEGRIVAGSVARPGGVGSSFVLVRYNGNGSLDTTLRHDRQGHHLVRRPRRPRYQRRAADQRSDRRRRHHR